MNMILKIFLLVTLGEVMAPPSSTLAWRIPGMGEPGGLPSMGLHRVGHDWRDLAAAAAAWLHIFSFIVSGKVIALKGIFNQFLSID